MLFGAMPPCPQNTAKKGRCVKLRLQPQLLLIYTAIAGNHNSFVSLQAMAALAAAQKADKEAQIKR